MSNETYKKSVQKEKYTNQNQGEIKVKVLLDSKDGEPLEGVRINLYRINGVSPYLEISKATDEKGKVCFSNLSYGNYRVIEIIDKKIYDKPTYLTWNEVNISNYANSFEVVIINKKKL